MDYNKRIQEIMTLRCPSVNKKGVKIPWKLLDKRSNDISHDFAYIVPTGYSVKDIRQETDAIYASCGGYVTIKDRGGVVVISINRKDFPSVIPYDPSFLDLTSGREVLCGFDILGKPITHNFRIPHILVGSQSGYGKTDLLRFWIYQLITRFTPEQIHIDIIDGKGFSFLPFRGIPHIRRIARDLSTARSVLQDAKAVMQKRSNEVWESNDREHINSYGWRLVIIDELAVISPSFQVSKPDRDLAVATYSDMASIACVGREASVGVIMATQRPDANVVHPQVKQNCDVSIALRCKTQTNSEIILDRSGAEKLPHGVAGRAIYSGIEDCIFQVPFIGKDDVWNTLLEPYRKEEIHHEESTETFRLSENLETFFQ